MQKIYVFDLDNTILRIMPEDFSTVKKHISMVLKAVFNIDCDKANIAPIIPMVLFLARQKYPDDPKNQVRVLKHAFLEVDKAEMWSDPEIPDINQDILEKLSEEHSLYIITNNGKMVTDFIFDELQLLDRKIFQKIITRDECYLHRQLLEEVYSGDLFRAVMFLPSFIGEENVMVGNVHYFSDNPYDFSALNSLGDIGLAVNTYLVTNCSLHCTYDWSTGERIEIMTLEERN